MIATLGALAALLIASAALGQGLLASCGHRQASSLAPALGLALLCPLGWGAVALFGAGTGALVALAAVVLVAALVAGRSAPGGGELLLAAAPIGAAALVLAALPFLVEGRFGILGTGLNPDMSQHLFASFALAGGDEQERLVASGYPLGPHSLVVALGELGVGPVQGFGGLTLAIALAACLAPLDALHELGPVRRLVACLLIGLPYMAASYLIQGAFKESLQALFVLALALYLLALERGEARPWRRVRSSQPPPLRSGLPLAALGAGSLYAYSFPGLAWLVGGLGVFAVMRLALLASAGMGTLLAAARAWLAPALVAAFALGIVALPELSRIIEFAGFETFDPAGAGLGNLFNPISPLEALGIWPSGDFRLDPGAGAVPAFAFWAGAVLGAVALAYGISWWLGRRELAPVAVLAGTAALIGFAVVAGTPYQASKAIALAAPPAMLVAAGALLSAAPSGATARLLFGRRRLARLAPRRARRARRELAVGLLTVAFTALAGGCTVLALANGPVGPTGYDPELRRLAAGLGPGSTLVLGPDELVAEQHGVDFLTWELRGGRVCVAADSSRGGASPRGLARVLSFASEGEQPPFTGLRPEPGRSGDYLVWEVAGGSARGGAASAAEPPCPYVADGARADPAG